MCSYIDEHPALEIPTDQNMMTIPVKTVLQIVANIVCHQMRDAKIVVLIASVWLSPYSPGEILWKLC